MKKLAKFSSVLVMVFILGLSFNRAFSQDFGGGSFGGGGAGGSWDEAITVTVTDSGLKFSGVGLDEVTIPSISLKLIRKDNVNLVTNAGPIGVQGGSFEITIVSLTADKVYKYEVRNSSNNTIIKSGEILFTQNQNSNPTPGPNPNPTPNPNPNPTPSPNTDTIVLENPLKGIGSIPQLIEAILNIVFKIGSWILAIFIIYVGYKFVAARGNSKELEEAKEALKYTLIGGAILMGAWVIAEAIVGTVEALK